MMRLAKRVLALMLCVVLCMSIVPTAYAHTQVMTAGDFCAYLMYVVNRRDSKYGSGGVYSVGQYDGTNIYFDCWGLGESIICTRGQIVINKDPSLNPWSLWDTSCGCGSRTGDWLKSQCQLSNDFSNIISGEWLFKDDSSGHCYHVGYYIGDGQVIESTSDGGNNTQISFIDSNGRCSGISGRGSSWAWTSHAKVPWIDYTGFESPDILPDSIGLTQHTSYTCTLASAAMMLRAHLYRWGNSNWSSVTEESIKSVAWCDDGLYHNFTYSIGESWMTVSYKDCSGMSMSELMSELYSAPEGIPNTGIVIYDRGIPHAVFVSDYQGEVVYCFDPANNYSGRRPLSDSYLGTRIGSQDNILRSIDGYWYVSSYYISPDESQSMTNGAGQTIPDGNYIIAAAADTRYYLDIDGAAYPANNNSNVILWGPRGDSLDPYDTWTVKYIDEGGFYSICQNGTSMALDVSDWSSVIGTNVQVYPSSQRWSISPNNNGSYRILAKCSGLSLDFDGGNLEAGTNVKQWSANDSIAQQWTFIPYEYVPPAPNNRIIFHPEGGTLGEPIASRNIDGVNTGRLGGQLIAYMSPLQYSDCNYYGHEIAVDSTGTVVGIREYGNENQLSIPDGGFVLSGQYAWPEDLNDGSHFLSNVAIGQYVGLDVDNMQAYIFDSYSDYLANFKYVKSNEQYGTLPEPVRDNYIFEGWYSAAEGGTEITSSSAYSTNELYAHWSAGTYTISYDANGGKDAPSSQTKIYDQTLTLSSDVPTRANTIIGSYTVTLNANGGSVSPASLTTNLTSSYSFKNWNTAANGSGTSYAPGASYTANAALTLYAQWDSRTTTAAVNLPTPTRDDCIFLGWGTSATAASGFTGSYTPTGNVTLYAIWLVPDFVLPASLTEIGEEAFSGCAFTYVKLSERTRSIGQFAFADCPNLRYIYIPAATTSIDRYAFAEVTGLTIFGKAGSYAEAFADARGFTFEAVD